MTAGNQAGSKGWRKQRLSAALRENLKRRKAQARGRAAQSGRAESAQADGGEKPNREESGESRSR